MAKYSTGSGGGSDDGAACELCGEQSSKLREANVAGATLRVCPGCAPHGENRHKDRKKRDRDGDRETRDDDAGSPGTGTETSRKKRTAQRTAKLYDARKGDSSHWEEEGTDYETDRLPYLVSGYGERAESARQEAGLTVSELADELDADEDDLLAVEQGRAARAGVGGSLVRRLEDRLDVELVDE